MKITFDAKRSNWYPYKVIGTANIHFTAESAQDGQGLRKIYSVYVGGGKVRVEDLPEFGERNEIKKLTISIDT